MKLLAEGMLDFRTTRLKSKVSKKSRIGGRQDVVSRGFILHHHEVVRGDGGYKS